MLNPGQSMLRRVSALALLAFATRASAQDPLLTTVDQPANLPLPDCRVCGSCSATFPDASVPIEWAEILPQSVVPTAGTVTSIDLSGGDLPFTHPFGFDSDLRLIPDSPGNLLRSSNGGLLVSETEQGLLPPPWRPVVGDRVVIHGRWIIDCGHNDFHTEIHQPALIAAARVSKYTVDLFATCIAPPFLTRQTFAGSNRPLLPHLLVQLDPGRSLTPLEAFPNIDRIPFSRSFTATYDVRLHTLTADPNPQLHFHFSHRTGVSVQVARTDALHAEVTIALDRARYKPADLNCVTAQFSVTDVDHAWGVPEGTTLGLIFAAAGALPAFNPFKLAAGVLTSRCAVPDVSAPTAQATDNQIVLDDRQPFPVIGWVGTNVDPNPAADHCSPQQIAHCRSARDGCMDRIGGPGSPTPQQCSQGYQNCLHDCPPMPRLAQLVVTEVLVPPTDPGRFLIRIDGVNTQGVSLGNGESLGPQNLGIGPHTVAELGGIDGTNLSKYSVTIGGDCDVNGKVTLALGQTKTCSVTNARKSDPQCSPKCRSTWQNCLERTGEPGSPTPAQCGQGLQNCLSGCSSPQQPQPSQLTVRIDTVPAPDPGRFNLLIDGTAYVADGQNGASTGPRTLTAGTHKVGGTTAAGTDPTKYTISVGVDCAPDGNVWLRPGDNKTCVVTCSRRPPKPGCLQTCEDGREHCLNEVGGPGHPTAVQCAQGFRNCQDGCQ